ncbi:MAG: hypothetical protein U1C74_21595 [Phenylobacterium sp.]|nr:hypothetical protein [Phenylobacterium sp.]
MTVLSNRQRRMLEKSIPAPPRYAKADPAVQASAARTRPAEDQAERDGLEWLERKGRLTGSRLQAAKHARAVIRAIEGPSLRSCLEGDGIRGSAAGFCLAPAEASASAKRELFVLRWVVLHGQDDLWTVVEGVCGGGHTLRGLAGGGSADQVKARAKVLETVLMIALDLVAHHLQAEEGPG